MSRKPGTERHDPLSPLLPPRTPGTLGARDAGDPKANAHAGDTPGSLGKNDGAAGLTSGRPSIPVRMLNNMILGQSPDAGLGRTGLFVYHVAIDNIPELQHVCPEPEKGPWRKTAYIKNVKDLVAVTGACGYRVSRLDILVHGDVGGRLWIGDDEVNPGTLDKYKTDLNILATYLTEDATVVLYGCVSGLSKDGSVLLKELSKLLSGRQVVGFNVINTFNARDARRVGGGWFGVGSHVCYDPEIWATDSRSTLTVSHNFVNVATPDAPQAKIAKGGQITKWPLDETAKMDDATKEDVLKRWLPKSDQKTKPDGGTEEAKKKSTPTK